MQFAHMTLVHLLNWESPPGKRPSWRNLLSRDHATASISSFSKALELALRSKIVSHIFHLKPKEMPHFIEPKPNQQEGDKR